MNCSKKLVWVQMRVLSLKQWGHCGVGVVEGSGSLYGNGEPIPRGPMDKFVISQPRQMNDSYWVPMVDAIANFRPRFKPPSMHELRIWILKEENEAYGKKEKIVVDSLCCSLHKFNVRGCWEAKCKSGGKGKGKALNLTPIHKDEELDELGGFDSGNFPTIDTLDEDDDDIGEDDLS
ncbi:hypothetical protein CK203_076926 [Vitis vinifera]|uniref:Uncharacterized protein n=1 Tax=Vitis vinifera TaxID=29760 RepID=A0A438E004_VITVI|nr:hypothetical protein CK203_076926 [Vitis vinifera]